MSASLDLSIVIPLLNEEESLRPLFQKIQDAVGDLGLSYEAIFIDDGSTDQSMAVLRELREKSDAVKIIRFRRNFGKAAAYSAAFSRVRGKYVITMDADLQDDPKRHDPLGKTVPSKFFNWVTGRVSGIDIHDFNCGLKGYRREVTQDVKIYGELHRYIPVLAGLEGYTVSEIPVQHHARQFGVTKYGWSRLFKGFLDLLTVMYLGRYMGRPLHLFGVLGVGLTGAGMAINAYIASLWLRTGSIQHRYPLLSLGTLLTVLGFQVICTGLIGDMVARASNPEEKYNIQEILE